MKYLSVREVAEAWEVSEAMIRKYCAQKRIPGAKQKGGVWVIPNTAKKPSSRMATSSRYEKLHPLACKLVRQKTKKNWRLHIVYVSTRLTISHLKSQLKQIK